MDGWVKVCKTPVVVVEGESEASAVGGMLLLYGAIVKVYYFSDPEVEEGAVAETTSATVDGSLLDLSELVELLPFVVEYEEMFLGTSPRPGRWLLSVAMQLACVIVSV